jgi:hypothetical protein
MTMFHSPAKQRIHPRRHKSHVMGLAQVSQPEIRAFTVLFSVQKILRVICYELNKSAQDSGTV